MKDINKLFSFFSLLCHMQALLAIQNILQNSNIFDRSRETVLFTSFGDKKVTQFSGFLSTSVSYLKVDREYFMWQFSNLFLFKTIKDTTTKFRQ